MNRIAFFLAIVFCAGLFSCTPKKVTLETLLAEMTDRTAITRLPENSFTLKQFSSYDRKSVSPDNNDWWANADYTQFIREEENEGRREFVLFDADGPGAVVRYWMTFAGEGASNGTLRFYFDENEMPGIEGNVLDVLSGKKLAVPPLAASVSPETEYEHRGQNLYLPIPYAQHCKITYECDAVKFKNNRRSPSIYYNICYRTYDSGTRVETFSDEVLSRAKSAIEKTAQELLTVSKPDGEFLTDGKTLAPSDEIFLETNEEGKAVSHIKIKLKAENLNQALRSTVLSVTFDDEESVWVPVGDFMGTGYQIFPSQTRYSKVSDSGEMESFWLMPFQHSAKIRLINFGDQPVDVNIEATLSDYLWNKTSLHFGASWHEFNRIFTAKDSSLENHEWHFDVNYVDLKGQGVYAGDALTVFNTVDAWWGEGDEKIFVDGESFPSFIGTGTEDYYGYAWCRPEKFSHPFIAQPTGAGNFHPGMTVNMRYRSLDVIPFQQELNSNIELWHWVKTRINFAMTAFWYAKPGVQKNVQANIESVKIPVAMKRSDIYKPEVNDEGKIEGEFLEVVSVGSGTVETQSGDFGWSNENQLWWRNGNTGDETIAKFILPESGKYHVSAQFTKAVDYGIFQLFMNEKPLGKNIDGFAEEGVPTFVVDFSDLVLNQGENKLTVKLIGANKKSQPGNMVGIDYLKFVPQK